MHILVFLPNLPEHTIGSLCQIYSGRGKTDGTFICGKVTRQLIFWYIWTSGALVIPWPGSSLEPVLRKQKMVVWFQLQRGSHRLFFVNKRTWISHGCPVAELCFQLKQQGLVISFTHRPSSLLLLKKARNPPMCVWKAAPWLCQPKVFINIKQGYRQPKASLLPLVLTVPLALRYLMRAQNMFLSIF